MNKLRVIIADDERPARLFLKAILQEFEFVEIIGEAENGSEALEIIREKKPDLALLDLQMPELTGLEVVKLLRKNQMPLVAFVTAFDEFAVQAFEVNAVDYLLKPIEKQRLAETLQRASERLEQTDFQKNETEKLRATVETYNELSRPEFIERIPVKRREEIILVPVREVVAIVAEGELLHITNYQNKKFIINYRLKDLEARIEPNKFIRLSRGALVNLEMISKVSPMPGGTYQVLLKNGQELSSSRLQSKILREKFFKI
ncbi:MAG: response regulator [Pyrinomonadaceae bacterium]|nr:response regulator [Pyrinomonadaceae bacterium]